MQIMNWTGNINKITALYIQDGQEPEKGDLRTH